MRSASARLVLVTLICLGAVAAAGLVAIGADPGADEAWPSCTAPAVGGTDPASSAQPVACDPVPSASPVPTAVVTITAHDVYFDPKQVTISSEGSTTIRLEDKGSVVHNFTVDELGILVVSQPGRSSESTIVDPPPGVYQFYCSVSGHREAGMVGTLTVLAPTDEPTSEPEPGATAAAPSPSPAA